MGFEQGVQNGSINFSNYIFFFDYIYKGVMGLRRKEAIRTWENPELGALLQNHIINTNDKTVERVYYPILIHTLNVC